MQKNIDIRKTAVVAGIAILFSLFIIFTIDALYTSPKYDDFCKIDEPIHIPRQINTDIDKECPLVKPPDKKFIEKCSEKEGHIKFEYDENNCETAYICETCYTEYSKARKYYNATVFYIAIITGLITIFAGMSIPPSKNELNTWTGSGFMFAGIILILYGTTRHFGDMDKMIRPLVLLTELILLIYISYKKLGNKTK